MKSIKVVNARTHNLKNVSLEVPKEMISVFSGISGSGKSSLAFDTIFAEGQRRYVENLSSYARQVVGVVEKPDVDSIEGIPPAIAIDQKSIVKSPRSTVGTLTEAYDYLRLLYARFGVVKCTKCGKKIFGGNISQILEDVENFILENGESQITVKIFSPIIEGMRGSHKKVLNRLSVSKFSYITIDGEEFTPSELDKVILDKDKPHTIKVEILNKKIKDIKPKIKSVLMKSVTRAFEISEETIEVKIDGYERLFSKKPYCRDCNQYFPSLQPRLFSFNSPYGACGKCQGLGMIKEIRPEKVIPNPKLTLAEGAIRPWSRLAGQNSLFQKSLNELSKRLQFSLDDPVERLDPKILKVIFYGDENFEGVITNLNRRYLETDSDYLRQEIEQYMRERMCNYCQGTRLNQYAKSVFILGKQISEMSDIEVRDLEKFFSKNIKELPEGAIPLAQELIKRLHNLTRVGLGYLMLSRSSETLSGGEAQRIRLGVQFDSFLSGVLYVLDEPTIGLHTQDTQKVISAFKKLKKEGNTVIIVEHDRMVLENADYIFDIGPGAGKSGGQLIASGTPAEIKKDKNSVTGKYLSNKKIIPFRKERRKSKEGTLSVIGATHNNLKNLDVEIPLGKFVCVSGVSGSGKSSLVYDIIAKALSQRYHNSEKKAGNYKKIEGVENLDKVIKIDQSPIGRTPRSNLATYTGIFTPVRELFANTAESKLRNYSASQFSFNLKGGRCDVCRGDGSIKTEMYFMPDVYIKCEGCSGTRYSKETLEIKYKGKNISQVLEMTVDDAILFFENNQEISSKLDILKKVGLGYLSLGQSATTLSGGEAQRVKLATELSRPSTGKTIYILDEPTTGLHFEDILRLLDILQELVDRGNTVLIIEHNLDIIKNADYVIDMGPEGGDKGGRIVAKGTPEEIAKMATSPTGKYLKEIL